MHASAAPQISIKHQIPTAPNAEEAGERLLPDTGWCNRPTGRAKTWAGRPAAWQMMRRGARLKKRARVRSPLEFCAQVKGVLGCSLRNHFGA